MGVIPIAAVGAGAGLLKNIFGGIKGQPYEVVMQESVANAAQAGDWTRVEQIARGGTTDGLPYNNSDNRGGWKAGTPINWSASGYATTRQFAQSLIAQRDQQAAQQAAATAGIRAGAPAATLVTVPTTVTPPTPPSAPADTSAPPAPTLRSRLARLGARPTSPKLAPPPVSSDGQPTEPSATDNLNTLLASLLGQRAPQVTPTSSSINISVPTAGGGGAAPSDAAAPAPSFFEQYKTPILLGGGLLGTVLLLKVVKVI